MEKTNITIESLLFNDEPITVNRKLAKCLGLKEAVIFQQIHYWLKINEKKNHNIIDGRVWTYNSVKKWHEEEFDFISLKTLERTLLALEKDGLLLTGMFNKMKGDKTKWYSIDYNKLLEVAEKRLLKKQELSQKRLEVSKKAVESKRNKARLQATSTEIDTIQPNWSDGAYNQIGQMIQPNWSDDTTKLVEPIPEITTKTSTKTSTSSSSAEVESNNLVDYFQDNICELKKTTRTKFKKFIESKSIEFVKALIDYQSEIGTKSFAGFKKAIDNFKDLETVEELNAAIEKFRSSKKQKSEFANNKSNKKKNNLSGWAEKDKDYYEKAAKEFEEEAFNWAYND